MHARFVLQPRERAVAVDLADHFLEAALGVLGDAQQSGAPAALLGVANVGPIEICGPESGFVAARAGADLDDHVALIVRVAGQ